MKNILVTGGTVFVSRYVAEYFAGLGHHVYVLNRGNHPQSQGVTFLEGDRHALGDILKPYHFDTVLDITAYNGTDITHLLDALSSFDQYVLISSSAVYPETAPQPFREETPLGENTIWGKYGTDKIEAENTLLKRVPHAYVLRPPYLYGPMNNLYREAFVFDCALAQREFYLPKEGQMNLQFFHVEDLCRFMDILLKKQPSRHVFNVGNPESISVRNWVKLCYEVAGSSAEFVSVDGSQEPRQYFSFYDYEYRLDVSRQQEWMEETKNMKEGLQEAFDWVRTHPDAVRRKSYMEFIDQHLAKRE